MINQLTNLTEAGVLLVDKPLEWTSFDVVNKIRNTISRAYNVKKVKVGHAGTLDPLATGLLILCTGKMTKQIDSFQAQEKEYTGKMIIGATTASFDAETPEEKTFDIQGIDEDKIKETTRQFIGNIEQTPPAYSAVKVNGVAAYKKVRNGEEVALKKRTIEISQFDIESVQLPEFSFRVKCSKGTYIRSLANDFGIALNNGAYLKELRRTKIGEHKVENAFTIEELVEVLLKLNMHNNASI